MLALIVTFAASAAAAAVAALSLDDFMGFPSHDFLVGKPSTSDTLSTHDRIAWIERQRGVVNLWVADETDKWRPRQLTADVSDDGGEICFLQFTLDGSGLVFSRGVQADVNPNHLMRLPETCTFFAPFAGGNTTKLACETARALSQDGHGFLYSKSEGDAGSQSMTGTSVWQMGFDPAAPPTQLFTLKQGKISGFVWNRQRDVLAFANNRGDHGFVGLYMPGQQQIMWVTGSGDTDMQPAWSPDGRRIAWVRARVPIGNVGYSPFDGNAGNRGPDFAIMIADVIINPGTVPVVSGLREVFRDLKFGMLNFGYGSRPLLWTNRSTVLFGTEAQSAWGQAVITNVDDLRSSPIPLREGECEDSDWILSEDNWVYLVNNCQDLDSSGIERVSLLDGTREAVINATDAKLVAGMSENGIGLTILSSHIVFIQATWNCPPIVHVMPLNGKPRPIKNTMDFASKAFVQPQLITFPSADGHFILHAQVFLPSNRTTRRSNLMPGIVYTHGGSERQMYPSFHYSSVYAQEYAVNQWFANQGAAVLSINYRSGTGYGHRFRVCEHCMSFGAAEYQDVRQAAVHLSSLPGVDAQQVGIWGLSYGGLNAQQACARDSGLFKACVSIAGIFNWISEARYFTDTGGSIYDVDVQPRFPGGFHSLSVGPEPAWAGPNWAGRVQKRQKEMLDSSPAGHVENLTSPMLLIQGDSDEEVSFQELIGALRAVRALGRDNVEVLVFPDEAHGLVTYAHQLQEMAATKNFLFKHLQSSVGVHSDVWV